jgi:hypothetical protein
MADVPADGSAAPGVSLNLGFDLDNLEIDAGVTGLSSPLQNLLSQLPAGIQAFLAWLPDLDLSQAETVLNFQSGAFGSYVAVSDGQNVLASTYLFAGTVSGDTQAAVGLTLNLPADLSATPLFGPLLSGVKISNLGVSYATAALDADQIILPAGSPPPTDVAEGLGLTFTVDAGGSAQSFALAGSSDGSGNGSGNGSQDNAASARASQADAAADLPPSEAGSASSGGGPPITWFAVQKSLGPLTVDQVGVVASSGTLGLAIDADLNTDVVSIQLTGFVITFEPASLASAPPGVSLDGLAASVDAGPVQIGGSLVRTQGPSGVEYDGSLLITIGPYAINAAGSYAVISGAPSLFVFGIAAGEFGGPPAFFITGFAAGFGVNRKLLLPTPDQVATFPLIAAAAEGPGFAPPGAQGAQDALSQLSSGGWVPPTLGEYWVAAGVKFQSFELVNGFALLTVEFGQELVIALLGVAAMQLPTPADGGPVFAYVEITLEATLVPAEGVLSIEALLTPNSFVIDPSCQLTGGVAFYLWFGSNPHAGDFVFTLGGYSPYFVPPAWYPAIPRLGFLWQLSDVLQITGESYFAVTPSCAMGGGRLALTFSAGGLSAWFTAQADFIMYWRPFSFDIDVSISIGVSYTGSIAFVTATFTVELGVSVELWGPPLQGIANVNWWVISFAVSINLPPGGGSSSPGPSTLTDWGTFVATSLPQASSSQSSSGGGTGSLCRAKPAGGLQSIISTAAGDNIWLFSGDSLELSTETVIPATQVVIDGPAPTNLPGLPVNVYPLGNVDVTSTHEVCIAAGSDWAPGQQMPAGVDVSGWGWATVSAALPAALWGSRGTQMQPSLGASVVPSVVGVTGIGQATTAGGLTVQAGTLVIDELPPQGLPLAGSLAGTGAGPAVSGDSRVQIAATINDTSVAALRAAVCAVAAESGLAAGLTAGALPMLAAEIYAVLTDAPMVGPVGSTGPQAPSAPSASPSAAAPAASEAAGADAAASDTPAAPGPAEATAPRSPGARPVLLGLFRPHQPAVRAGGLAARPAAASRPPRTSATILDRWSTSRDIRLAGDGEPGARLLWPGTTVVWDVPDQASRLLGCEATTPLWIVATDLAQRIVQIETVAPGETEREIPAEATRVAVTALAHRDDVWAVGWTADARLRQLASQTLLGDGVVVRPQSPGGVPRRRCRRSRRFARELGVVTGRQLVERNLTVGTDRTARHGWVETYFPAWCHAVTVRLLHGQGAGSQLDVPVPRIRLERRQSGQPTAAIRPAVTDYRGDGARAIWRFAVPDDLPAAGHLVLRAGPPDGWSLDAVLGLADPAAGPAIWSPDGETAAARPAPAVASRVWWE